MLNKFENIVKIIETLEIVSLKRNINSIRNLLSDNKYIDIAVIGQFKAGKSSFINSFLELEILPVGVIPTTSVITRICYGSKKMAVVSFIDGNQIDLNIDELDNYIVESKNPNNFKKVSLVDIFLPTLIEFKSIRFVDTPGMGSYYKHNSETTKDWSPDIGFSLMTISAERPLSENEMQLIKELSNYTPKIIILLTKIDLFSNEQLIEIKNFIINAIKKEFNYEFLVLYYSIFKDTSLHRAKLKEKIIYPLLNNLNNEINSLISYKIHFLAKETLNYLEILKQSLLRNQADKDKIKSLIFDEKLNIELIYKELKFISNSYTYLTRAQLVKDLDKFKHFLYEKMIDEFDINFNNFKGHLGKLTKKFEEWSNNFLRNELYEISDKNHYLFLKNFLDAQKHFSNYLKSFREKINANIEAVFGIKIESEIWKIDITEIKQPDIIIGRAFDSHIELLWFLFPMFIFKKIFLKHFKSEIYDLIEINFSRLASDYTERINNEILKMANQSFNYISDEIKTVESLLTNSNSNLDELSNYINQIKNFTE